MFGIMTISSTPAQLIPTCAGSARSSVRRRNTSIRCEVWATGLLRRELDPQQTFGVLVKNLPLGRLVRGQPPDARKNLRAIAWSAATNPIIAIGPEDQLVLVLVDKPSGVVLVARLEIQSRTCRGVAVHVRIITQ